MVTAKMTVWNESGLGTDARQARGKCGTPLWPLVRLLKMKILLLTIRSRKIYKDTTVSGVDLRRLDLNIEDEA